MENKSCLQMDIFFAISTFATTEERSLALHTHTPEKALNIPTRELAPHIERQQDEEYTAGVHQRIEFKIIHLRIL